MAGTKKHNVRGETGFDPKMKDLECFLNQPNINMVIPWVYDIYKNMAKPKSRDGKESKEDKVEKNLQCFLNQPNINMVIPWVYSIYRSVKEGGGGDDDSYEWEDLTK